MGVIGGGGGTRTEAIKREIASLRAPTKLPLSLSAKLDAAAAAADLSPTSLDDATAASFSFPASGKPTTTSSARPARTPMRPSASSVRTGSLTPVR